MIHAYAPVEGTAAEMRRLVDEIRSEAFETAHPAEQAAYAHYAFVQVHPFADGNGRVARALASVFFYRSCSIPLVIFADQRNLYLEDLELADDGEGIWLTRFFANRGIETMNLIGDALEVPSLDEMASEIREATQPYGLPSQMKLEQIGWWLLTKAEASFEGHLRKLDLASTWEVVRDEVEEGYSAPLGFRRLSKSRLAHVRLSATALGSVSASLSFRVLVSARGQGRIAFRLERLQSGDSLDVTFEEAFPQISTALSLRLDMWTERLLGELLVEAKGKLQQSFEPLR